MLKKIITLMMVVSIFTVQAHASTQDGLKAAFDEMNYSLTVEWDQKDQAFYEDQLKKFTSVVRDLKKTGLTNSEMIDFAKSQIKDAKVAKDLETAFSMITINKMSSEDASKYIISTMKRAYSNGASWNGDAVLYLVAGIIIVAIAVGLSKGTSSVPTDGSFCYEECYAYPYDCGGHYYCSNYTWETVCN